MSGQQPDGLCNVPPAGWYCTREAGHEPPCAAWPVKWYSALERLRAEAAYLLHRTGLRSYCHHHDRIVWSRHFRRCNCAARRRQLAPLISAIERVIRNREGQ